MALPFLLLSIFAHRYPYLGNNKTIKLKRVIFLFLKIKIFRRFNYFFQNKNKKIIVSALVLYLLITEQINISSWFWTLIAISGPILCLINAKELCNVFQPGMLEIQITAKNSFSKVLMVRLTIFGLFDLLFFITMALALTAALAGSLIYIGLELYNYFA